MAPEYDLGSFTSIRVAAWLGSGMRVLSERDVNSIVPPNLAIEAAEEAFRIHSLGAAQIPMRSEIHREEPAGTALIMCGLVEKDLGVKLVASVENRIALTKLTTCLMLLWDADTLRPRGLVSADNLNVHRTAASFAAATKALARPDSVVHSVYGAGKLSLLSILYVARVRPIRRVIIVSRTRSKVLALIDEVKAHPELGGLEIVADASAEEAASLADVVTTVTTSNTPVFEGQAIRAGTHLNLGGANRPHQREADNDVASRASFWVDSMEGCRARAGDILLPLNSGCISSDQIVGELGEVFLGRCRGRSRAEEITIFKSLGLATQDIVLGSRILDIAEEKDLGLKIDVING